MEYVLERDDEMTPDFSFDLSGYDITEQQPIPAAQELLDIMSTYGSEDVGAVSWTEADGDKIVLVWRENNDFVTLDGRVVLNSEALRLAEVQDAYYG